MNILKTVEFIFVIMILVFLAIFIIFIILCIEVYSFLTAVEAPIYIRIIILSGMGFVFIYILRGIILKAEEYRIQQ